MEIVYPIYGILLFDVYCCLSLLSGEIHIWPFRSYVTATKPPLQESAGKTLEEMDLLFVKGRTPWVFLDKEATKIGSILERDLARGEALTDFDKVVVDDAELVVVSEKTESVAARV